MKYFVCLLLLCSLEGRSQGLITIRLSYKVILNPDNGARPVAVTDQDLQNNVDDMNTLMEATWRGYRFQLTEIVEVGGVDSPLSEKWYDTDIDITNKGEMEGDATGNPIAYGWRNNAVNIYINQGEESGICSFPAVDNLIVIGGSSDYYPSRHIHEIGHYFDLCHTQGCSCGTCEDGEGPCNTVPGTDNMFDTLPDLACWSRSDIANNAFGKSYNELNQSQKSQVDFTYENIMSYHNALSRSRLTEDQLDRWTDVATFTRSYVTDKNAYFVKPISAEEPLNIELGTSMFPFVGVANGISSVNSGNVLILRPGMYHEPMTMDKSLTLRATRDGMVTIGGTPRNFSEDDDELRLVELEERAALNVARILEQMERLQVETLQQAEQEEGLTPPVSAEALVVYPNPNEGAFTLSVDLPRVSGKVARLSLYDSQRTLLFSREVRSGEDLSINLQDHPKGVYLAHLSIPGVKEIYQRVVYR